MLISNARNIKQAKHTDFNTISFDGEKKLGAVWCHKVIYCFHNNLMTEWATISISSLQMALALMEVIQSVNQ